MPAIKRSGYVTARVKDRELKSLCRIAKSERRSISQIVQFAIQIYLETYRKAAGK